MTRDSHGFTLVELVVVIIVVGILAVFAFSRLNTSAFEPPAFYQEALAAGRYAQKEAVAKRRVVCVAVTSTTVTLSFAPVINSSSCTAALTSPRGSTPFVVTAPSNVTITPTPTFTFDPLGRPSAAQSFTISGGTGLGFVVEAETGYVH